MFFFTEQAADYQSLAIFHAYVSIGGTAVDAVVFQLADQCRRADLGMNGRSDQSILTDDGGIG